MVYIVLYTYLPGFLPGYTGIPVYRVTQLKQMVTNQYGIDEDAEGGKAEKGCC